MKQPFMSKPATAPAISYAAIAFAFAYGFANPPASAAFSAVTMSLGNSISSPASAAAITASRVCCTNLKAPVSAKTWRMFALKIAISVGSNHSLFAPIIGSAITIM